MPRGRPKIEIDWAMVERLATIFCTEEEIAAVLGISVKTLRSRKEFFPIYKKGRERGKISLRRAQFNLARKNTAMAIWLGKQLLGQKDEPEDSESERRIDEIEFVELR